LLLWIVAACGFATWVPIVKDATGSILTRRCDSAARNHQSPARIESEEQPIKPPTPKKTAKARFFRSGPSSNLVIVIFATASFEP
jgi:hypothetical protein